MITLNESMVRCEKQPVTLPLTLPHLTPITYPNATAIFFGAGTAIGFPALIGFVTGMNIEQIAEKPIGRI